jgi:hypothetical protein
MYRANSFGEWYLLFGLQEAVIPGDAMEPAGNRRLVPEPKSSSDGVVNHVAVQAIAYYPAHSCHTSRCPRHNAARRHNPAARHGSSFADPGRNPTQQRPVSQSYWARCSSGRVCQQQSERQHHKCSALGIAAFSIVRAGSGPAPDCGLSDAGRRRAREGLGYQPARGRPQTLGEHK